MKPFALLAVIASILSTPFKAVARPGKAAFINGLDTLRDAASWRPAPALGRWPSIGGAMHQALVDSIKCSMVLIPASAHNTTRLSKFVDTMGYSFFEFHVGVGATDDKVDAKLQESVNADGSAASDVTGGAITQIATTGDNVLVVITVAKQALTKRYVGVLVTIDATGAAALTYAESFRWGKTGSPAMGPESQETATANSYATSQVIRVS